MPVITRRRLTWTLSSRTCLCLHDSCDTNCPSKKLWESTTCVWLQPFQDLWKIPLNDCSKNNPQTLTKGFQEVLQSERLSRFYSDTFNALLEELHDEPVDFGSACTFLLIGWILLYHTSSQFTRRFGPHLSGGHSEAWPDFHRRPKTRYRKLTSPNVV